MKRAALLLLGITLPAFADRFNVTFEGKPVSRAQVCASRAGDLASPMTRFFTGTATVCFPADGEVQLLKTAESFMEATDFVFDEVLWQREPGDLQIVRVDNGRREVAWSFRPGTP